MKQSLFYKILLLKRLTGKSFPLSIFIVLIWLFIAGNSFGQVTVFSDNFSTNTNTTWTANGSIGASAWSVLRSGDDWGARRNVLPQQLEFTNDTGVTTNLAGWIFGSTPTTAFASPYNPILEESGIVSWTFNMRQINADPEGFNSGQYGVAFILAGETVSSAFDGSGYAVVLGQPGSTDPVRLVSYSSGMMGNSTLANIIVSNTTGLTDFGDEHLSIKVTYNPCANDQWELFVRNDGSSFVDPSSGSLTSQGSAINNTYTGIPLDMMSGYWQGATEAAQTAFIDNVTVQVTPLPVADAGSYAPVCTNDPDVVLMGTPAGGVFSGPGVNGNLFNPNAGTQMVTYTVTDVNGCTGSDQATITVNPCITAPEMRWILLEEGIQHGVCVSQSDCDDDVVCYGLQYTPNATGNLTSYTTGFVIDCNDGTVPVISSGSCVMNSVDSINNDCAQSDLILLTAAGNGILPVTQGTSYILHQVCLTIPQGIISIAEHTLTDLTTAIDPNTTEYPSYVTSTVDSTLDCSILPLRFLSFNATRYDDLKSQLDWVTVDECNNSHFEIQRSTDGGASFQPIGTVKAVPQPKPINHYQFIDNNARVGQNYYRLKQVDLDDKFQYSQVRNVFFGTGAFSVRAWPNPVADVLFLRINHAEENGKISLVDVQGKEVFSRDFTADESEIKLNVDAFQPGTYTLVVKTGAISYEEKIIIVDN